MIASRACIDFIAQHEGFRTEAYQDGGGVWTIGYGSTGGVRMGDRITEPEARERLMRHVEEVERAVSKAVSVSIDQSQFDALVSLVYNIGAGQFAESTLLRKLNAGKVCAACAQFSRWNKINGKTSAGLAERRSAEAIMFAGDR